MKKKLVLWVNKGSGESLEKVLVALELKPNTNKVLRNVIAQEFSTEELALKLLTKWRKGEAVELPENTVVEEFDLSASVPLLSEELVANDLELVQRTQTEWIFIVLSTKLYKSYKAELDEIQEGIDALEKYSKKAWEGMKNFWSKVQEQIKEHNLFKEHSHALKTQTNGLFDQLKKLRVAEDAAFESESVENANSVIEKLEPIEKAATEEGSDFKKLFNQLKSVQDHFKSLKLTRTSRSKLWDRIDKAFKVIKEKRSPGSSTSTDIRLVRRIDGLKNAINKMATSIARDQKELDMQEQKLNASDVGELETQLREVKAKLIKERITSKSKKIEDMHKTLAELETRLKKMEARQAKEAAIQKERDEAAAAAVLQKEKEAAAAAVLAEEKPTIEEKTLEEELKTPEVVEIETEEENKDEE